jgi:hypothetical protein
MARKKKTLSATKLVKEQARDILGTPPPSRPLPDRRADANRKSEKHKRDLKQIAESE